MNQATTSLAGDWQVGVVGLNQEAEKVAFLGFSLYSKVFLEKTESTSHLESEDLVECQD